MISQTYTIYPSWFGGEAEALMAMKHLGQREGERQGLTFIGARLVDEEPDNRGHRFMAIIDYNPLLPL